MQHSSSSAWSNWESKEARLLTPPKERLEGAPLAWEEAPGGLTAAPPQPASRAWQSPVHRHSRTHWLFSCLFLSPSGRVQASSDCTTVRALAHPTAKGTVAGFPRTSSLAGGVCRWYRQAWTWPGGQACFLPLVNTWAAWGLPLAVITPGAVEKDGRDRPGPCPAPTPSVPADPLRQPTADGEAAHLCPSGPSCPTFLPLLILPTLAEHLLGTGRHPQPSRGAGVVPTLPMRKMRL